MIQELRDLKEICFRYRVNEIGEADKIIEETEKLLEKILETVDSEETFKYLTLSEMLANVYKQGQRSVVEILKEELNKI